MNHSGRGHGSDRYDVVVVGAGQAGLAIGYYLRKQGHRFVLLDDGPQVGHVWRSRWDSLRLFTPARYASLPGMPFPAAPDTYPDRDQVAAYLQTYATTFDLPIQLDTHVTAIEPAEPIQPAGPGAGGFLVRAGSQVFHADTVVVATGPFQTPYIPAAAAGLEPEVMQLHSSQFRNAGQLPDGPVAVVGGGNSGFQIAAEVADSRPATSTMTSSMTSSTILAVGRRNVTIPQRVLGRDIFWWQSITGLINLPADSWLGRRIRQSDGTVIGSSIKELQRKNVTLRPGLTSCDGHTIGFVDGTTTDVTAVIWATGFRIDHSFIHIPGALDEHGRLRHHRGVTTTPGLYVLGLPWLYSTGSALLGFVKNDAHYLANHIANHATGHIGTQSNTRSIPTTSTATSAAD